jgi:uncharacterized protein (DUF1697 family)
MPTWIAFFRGINVGGKSTLPMKELVPLLEERGCTDIRTYIQSGNVVFQSSEAKPEALSRRIASSIARQRGLEVGVVVLSPKQLKKAIAANPFPDAESDPKSLHVYFLADDPGGPYKHAMEKLKADTESFVFKRGVLYLHTPKGFGKSKLAAGVERATGVSATARNWKTVTKVLEMAESAG